MNFFALQNDRQCLSFMKDEHTYCKKMARQGRKKVICKGTFISIQTLYWFLAKNLAFWTHHLENSTTELISSGTSIHSHKWMILFYIGLIVCNIWFALLNSSFHTHHPICIHSRTHLWPHLDTWQRLWPSIAIWTSG